MPDSASVKIVENTKETPIQAEIHTHAVENETTQTQPQPQDEKEIQHAAEMEEYANTVVTIMIPVAITMILVVWTVRNISDELSKASGSGMTIYNEKEGDSTSTKFFGSLANAIIIVGAICIITVVMVLLYKFKCMKILWGWIMGSTGVLLIGFCAFVSYLLIQANNLLLDYISWAFILYNFGVVGMIAVFWHAPRYINQAYLILISAFTAILFTRLPEWTTWIFLGLIAVYDLFAVLFPKGPLNILLQLSQERNETIPALIYNASVYMVNTASPTQPRNEEQRPTETELRTNDNNNNNDNEAMPETNIDLTGPPSLEAIKSGDVKEVINDVPPRIDSQGTLSPEAKKEVFVDIPLSSSITKEHHVEEVERKDESSDLTVNTVEENTTKGERENAVQETAESEKNGEDGEPKQHRRKHRHHHHHEHRHRHHHRHRHDPSSSTCSTNNEKAMEEGDVTTADPQVGDPTGHDASSSSHHRHHHRSHRHYHHHRQRDVLPQKADDITQSPHLVTAVPPLPPSNPAEQVVASEEEERGVKLGLGDFIFYSVLIGRAALFDITTVFTCFIAIVTGLFITLLLLAFFKRPLPALPVSVALGIIFYFLTRVFLVPYIKYLGLRQFFV